MNNKIEPSENQEFIPVEVSESAKVKLSTAEKNVLGTLCFYYLNHSIYASEHDGWFFKDQKTIFEESNLSPAEGKRILLKLVFKRLIERGTGTNHRCTRYRLHQAIRNLMPQNQELKVEISDEKIANEPLEEKSRVETSRDESRRDERTEENNGFSAPLEEDASNHKNAKDLVSEWRGKIKNAKTRAEVESSKEWFMESAMELGGLSKEDKSLVDEVYDLYQAKRYCLR